MYNYNPTINALRKQSIEKAKRLKEKLSENSNDESQQKKKNVNLLIVVEPDGKAQFDDTHNTIWEVREIPSFANYESFVDLCKRFDFKNVAVVHHGNAFSVHNYKDELLISMGASLLKALHNVYEKVDKIDLLNINDEYINAFEKKSEVFHNEGIPIKYIEAYLSLRLLISNMLENSCFFSVACNEADDKDFAIELAKMTNKKMKIFTNSNFSSIKSTFTDIVEKKHEVHYGSMLNKYITPSENFFDSDGWKCFDTFTGKTAITKKDLWLYSSNKLKIYDLFDRDFKLNKSQEDKIIATARYYSKKYKIFYEKYVDLFKNSFETFKAKTKNKYPDVIN